MQHTFFGTKLCWPYVKRPKRSIQPSFQQYQQAFSLLVLLERFVAQNGCHQGPGSERDLTLWIVHVSRASAGINNPFQHRIESSSYLAHQALSGFADRLSSAMRENDRQKIGVHETQINISYPLLTKDERIGRI